MGRRKDVQAELLICPAELPDGGGHVFYEKLNQLLSKHGISRGSYSYLEFASKKYKTTFLVFKVDSLPRSRGSNIYVQLFLDIVLCLLLLDYYSGLNRYLLHAVPTEAQRILEVGCGEGRLGAGLKAMDSRRTVYGVEQQAHASQLAAQHLDQFSHSIFRRTCRTLSQAH